MTLFAKNGNTWAVAKDEAMDIRKSLPVGAYVVKFSLMQGFYLEGVDAFKVEGKVYGDVAQTTERILNTFESRPQQTGVLLSGVAGTGKTMLSKNLSVVAAERGIPTLVVNEAHYGDGFNSFIQSIDQGVLVIFDEFEKVYEDEQQQQLLTLFDGVYPSKKLFVITANDRYKINQHMINRPGRIFYNIEYTGLSQEFIIEYCEDVLDKPEHAEQVARFALLFAAFSFDMLKAIVEEINRYGEAPAEAARLLNIKPSAGGSIDHDVAYFYKGERVDEKYAHTRTFNRNPLAYGKQHNFLLYGTTQKDKFVGDDEYDDDMQVRIDLSQPVKVDVNKGEYVYESGGWVIVFSRQKESAGPDYWQY